MKTQASLVAIGLAILGCAPMKTARTDTDRRTAEGDVTEGYVPDANAPRSKVPDTYKWSLASLFESDEAFAGALEKLEEQRAQLAGFKGKLGNPRKLRECLDLYFDTRLLTNKATLYGGMKLDSAKASTEAQAMNDRAQGAMKQLMSSASFIRQEILALDDKVLGRAYKKDQNLAAYRPYIDQLRRRKLRVLGSEAERILSLGGDNLWAEIDLNEIPSDHEKTFGALLTDIPLPTIKDADNKSVQLTLASYGKYRGDDDRRVRRDTVESFFQTLMRYRHALASTLSGQIRFNIFLARSRGYDTALEAYLDKDAIDPEVYTSLIDAIRANLEPLHRYVKLRKRVMGVEELHIYDLYTPMVHSVKLSFPYDKAREILLEALAPLGDEYLAVLREGLDPANGWIDVYPHKDKKSGAFSASVERSSKPLK